MGLEATIIIIDNSKYSLNGDILPSRFDAQTDALDLLARSKLDENQESSVGLMTMGGHTIQVGKASKQVLLTPIQEKSQIMAAIHKVDIGGESDFSRAIKIATLSLKHRANKNQRQRIIAMVASPLQESAKDLEAVGKKLKKNQIAIDIINLGKHSRMTPGEPSNLEKINALVAAVNVDDNSHAINVEPSISLLPDILSTSALLGRGVAETGNTGMDAGMDDDMQAAIRMSLEEEQRRIEAIQQQAAAAAGTTVTQATQSSAMQTEQPTQPEPTELEKDLLRKAKEMSVNPKEGQITSSTDKENQLFEDPDFIKDILKDLNVDTESKDAKELIQGIRNRNEDQKKDKKKEDEEKKDDKEKQ